MNSSHWKLKVMSGFHKGAELQIPCGKTTLGNDDIRADLVFDNQGLESVHLLLEVVDERTVESKTGVEVNSETSRKSILFLSVIAENSEVLVNGSAVRHGTVEVPDRAIITTGKLVLAVVLGDNAWLDPEQFKGHGESAPVKDEPVKDEAYTQVPNVEEIDQTSQVNQAQQPVERGSFFHRIFSWKPGSKPYPRSIWKLCGIALMVIGLFVLTTVMGLKYGQLKSDTKVALSSLEKGQQMLARMHFNEVKLLFNEKRNLLEISGYIETERDKRKLLSQLKSMGISYKGRVWVVERIVRSVNFTLEELGFNRVVAEAGVETGSVVLKGNVDSRERWADLEVILDNDIPGLKSWKLDFGTKEDRALAFNDILSKTALGNRLTVQVDSGTVKALGVLTKEEQHIFYQAAETYRQHFGSTPELQAYPRYLNADSLPVKGISLGEDPFLVLDDNQKYLIGQYCGHFQAAIAP